MINRIALFFTFSLIFQLSCETKTTTVDACGDGIVDPGEQCDGTVGAQSCESIGYYNQLGTLTCKDDCTFNTADCGGTCGDTVINVDDGELCDTVELGSATCLTLGYYGGVLACGDDCTEYDMSDCTSSGRCGDGVLHLNFGEVCDTTALNGETCETRGYQGGTLACRSDCQDFDTSGCAGACGDDTVQTEAGEVCDGDNLDGQSCETLGYYGGELTCLSTCNDFNTANCAQVGRCGDNAVQISFGEECDGTSLNSQTCLTLGYYGGALACSNEECLFDAAGCSGRCGDGILQLANEECDGAELNSQTCETRGYNPGTLACTGVCGFDISACNGRCGDGMVDPPDEECEGTGLNGQTCVSIGFIFGGALSCIAQDCWFNRTACNTVTAVAGGGMHTCARFPNGTLRCWGDNASGQLGNNSTTGSDNPVAVSGITDAIAVDAGTLHTCAITGTGSIKCWGENENGQLGIGSTIDQLTPTTIVGITNARVISAGGAFTCAVLTDDTVRCWGLNTYGQLGDGSVLTRNSPVTVTGLSNVATLSASWGGHTCAVLNNGTAKCWGLNSSGQLGNNGTNNSSSPVSVYNLTTAVQITTNQAATCARLSGGTVQCWGNNLVGQLGDGTNNMRLIPTTVLSLTGVSDISSGNGHTCAAFPASKSLRCWGANTYGQIGDGSLTDRNSPVIINLNSYADSLGVGGGHSCVIHNDGGSISCWGRNTSGQLGHGDLTVHRVPTLVVP